MWRGSPTVLSSIPQPHLTLSLGASGIGFSSFSMSRSNTAPSSSDTAATDSATTTAPPAGASVQLQRYRPRYLALQLKRVLREYGLDRIKDECMAVLSRCVELAARDLVQLACCDAYLRGLRLLRAGNLASGRAWLLDSDSPAPPNPVPGSATDLSALAQRIRILVPEAMLEDVVVPPWPPASARDRRVAASRALQAMDHRSVRAHSVPVHHAARYAEHPPASLLRTYAAYATQIPFPPPRHIAPRRIHSFTPNPPPGSPQAPDGGGECAAPASPMRDPAKGRAALAAFLGGSAQHLFERLAAYPEPSPDPPHTDPSMLLPAAVDAGLARAEEAAVLVPSLAWLFLAEHGDGTEQGMPTSTPVSLAQWRDSDVCQEPAASAYWNYALRFQAHLRPDPD